MARDYIKSCYTDCGQRQVCPSPNIRSCNHLMNLNPEIGMAKKLDDFKEKLDNFLKHKIINGS